MSKILVVAPDGSQKAMVEDVSRLFPNRRFEYATTISDAAGKLAGAKIVILAEHFGRSSATGNDLLKSTRGGSFSFSVIALEEGELNRHDSRVKYAGHERSLLVQSLQRALLFVED